MVLETHDDRVSHQYSLRAKHVSSQTTNNDPNEPILA